jgi:outer membrane protein TolC
MKKLSLIVIAVITVGSSASFAQMNVDGAIASILQNNTALKALKEDLEAQKQENKTGIWLPNPELEFNYLWGSPLAVGIRKDISIRQTFDFATVTGMKKKIADGQNRLLELQYRAEKLNIQRQATLYCIDLMYYNALRRELDLRREHADALVGGYKSRLDRGDANMLEYNKAQLNQAAVKGEISNLETERKSVLSELRRLNGGIDMPLNGLEYGVATVLPKSFDAWFAQAEQKSPLLEYVKQEVEISKRQLSLNKAKSLPNISAGFMREKVTGEAYQGISLGVSIPLWENKNRVRQAKAAILASQAKQTDSRIQFYEYLKNLYERTKGLQAVVDDYNHSLSSINSSALLKKALDAGEISLLDYILETGLYYNAVNLKLNAEREFQKAFAELMSNVLESEDLK